MINESVVRSSTFSKVDEDKRESARAWKAVIVWSILILAVTSIPYLFAYVTAPTNSEFMGIIHNAHDYGAYRSWIRQAGQGFLIQDQLTLEPNEPVIFNPLWIILGKAESALGLSFPQLFQIERWVVGLALLLIAYNFFGRFFADRTQRLFALLFFGLSSGFGWVLVLLNKLGIRIDAPLDIYLAPGNTLVSLMTSPHFAVALILLLVTFFLVLDGWEKRQWRYWIGAGLSALLLGLVHYELVTVYAVLSAFLGLTWLRDRFNFRWIASGLIVLAFSVSAVIYQLLVYQTHPLWREVLAQYPNLGVWTPNPFHLIVTIGLGLVLAASSFAHRHAWHVNDHRDLFIKLWFVVNLIVIYLPVQFQAMLLNGWQVPISILTTAVLFQKIIPWLRAQSNGLIGKDNVRWMTAVLVIVALTNIYWIGWRVFDLSRHEHPYYLSHNEVSALNWLEQNASANTVVLSSLSTGFYLPGVAGVRPVLAHGTYTVDFYNKRDAVTAFANPNMTDADRQSILSKYRVDLVFYGPMERELGAFRPETANYLDQVFAAGDVQIFRVNAP